MPSGSRPRSARNDSALTLYYECEHRSLKDREGWTVLQGGDDGTLLPGEVRRVSLRIIREGGLFDRGSLDTLTLDEVHEELRRRVFVKWLALSGGETRWGTAHLGNTILTKEHLETIQGSGFPL